MNRSIAICGIVLLVAAVTRAAEAPATQPSTQPTTVPATFDAQAAMTMLQTCGGLYQSIHQAVDKKDFDTARDLADDLLNQSDALQRTFKGTTVEVPVNLGLAQFRRLRDALANKDAEKTKTLMQGLDTIGDALGTAVEKMVDATKPKPAATQPAQAK